MHHGCRTHVRHETFVLINVPLIKIIKQLCREQAGYELMKVSVLVKGHTHTHRYSHTHTHRAVVLLTLVSVKKDEHV